MTPDPSTRDGQGSDRVTDDGQSDEDEFSKDVSDWRQMEEDDTSVKPAISRTMRIFPNLGGRKHNPKTGYSLKIVFRAILEVYRVSAYDIDPTKAHAKALIKLSTTLERQSSHSNPKEELSNAITATEIAVQAMPKERPELAQLVDSSGKMLVRLWRWIGGMDMERAIQISGKSVRLEFGRRPADNSETPDC